MLLPPEPAGIGGGGGQFNFQKDTPNLRIKHGKEMCQIRPGIVLYTLVQFSQTVHFTEWDSRVHAVTVSILKSMKSIV